MGNIIFSIVGWFWTNFIGWPREESRFTGFIRMWLYLYLMMADKNYLPTKDEDWTTVFFIFLFIQFIIGIAQFFGAHSINSPTDFKLNKQIKDGIYDGSITVISNQYDKSFEQEYPGLTWWFRVRENEMSAMSNSEKARFFIETGGLTEGSIREMSNYRQTKRALQRLDYECRRPHKELVNYMRGVKIK